MTNPSSFPEPEPDRHVIMFSAAFTPDAAVALLSDSIGAQAASEIVVAGSRDSAEPAGLDPRSGARVALSFTGDGEGDGPVAVVTPLDDDQLRSLRQAQDTARPGSITLEKEQFYTTAQHMYDAAQQTGAGPDDAQLGDSTVPSLFPLGPGGDLVYGIRIPREYVAAAERLQEREGNRRLVAGEVSAAGTPLTELTHTWGLQATGAHTSPFDGRGINVAVLDTGFNFQHPDFQGGISPTAFASFIAGESAADANGHGTHTAGTAAGPRVRPSGLGYGIAHKSQLYIGKVLGNSGTGSTAQILEGIRWALHNNCEVINMSLARRVALGETTHSEMYETIAQHALDQGALIIAAAGNFSSRPALTWPVCEPANCPSIMAVGAVDEFDRIAPFSCASGSTAPVGARVDIAGPGVRVYSSYKQPELYATVNGTSMAAPHVSGIAALYAQVSPDFRGTELWSQLARTARRLPLPPEDVGFGLVRAP